MKTTKQPSLAIRSQSVLWAAAFFVASFALFGQGPLTPPGPPGPTMKTLEQIEPRTPIASLPFTITNGGSYYLSADLTLRTRDAITGITIESDNVTLDLGGFTLAGISTTGFGIFVPESRTNLCVRNGVIRGWGLSGIVASTAVNSQFERLRISGCGANGLSSGPGSAVSDCLVEGNRGRGIWVGVRSRISRCLVSANANIGINAGDASTVQDSTVVSNILKGILVGAGCRVIGCTAFSNGGDGVEVSADSQVSDNTCRSNRAAGIRVTGTGNRIEANHIAGNQRGLHIQDRRNLVSKNSVRANDDNYDIVDQNQLEILLCEIPENIEWPATVVLAGSLTYSGSSGTNGITIKAKDVTIDLGGHALIGVAGSLDAIAVFAPSVPVNLAVRNGTVRDWGRHGVNFDGNYLGHLERVRAWRNGIDGIRTGDGCTVNACAAHFNGSNGIVVGRDCLITGNLCLNNGRLASDGAGIRLVDRTSRIEANHVARNDVGISRLGRANLVVKNSAAYNQTNFFSISSGFFTPPYDARGEILTFFNLGGVIDAADSAWANFEFVNE